MNIDEEVTKNLKLALGELQFQLIVSGTQGAAAAARIAELEAERAAERAAKVEPQVRKG